MNTQRDHGLLCTCYTGRKGRVHRGSWASRSVLDGTPCELVMHIAREATVFVFTTVFKYFLCVFVFTKKPMIIFIHFSHFTQLMECLSYCLTSCGVQ